MATVTGKVVNIQLTIEYTREGEYAPFHTKTVTLPRSEAESIGALILSKETHDEIAGNVHSDNITTGLTQVHSLQEDSGQGFTSGDEATHTLAVVYKDKDVDEAVVAACGGTHPKTWSTE